MYAEEDTYIHYLIISSARSTLVSLDLGGLPIPRRAAQTQAHNRIGPFGVKDLRLGMYWTPLCYLDLSYNNLQAQGATTLAAVLGVHSNLTQLSLGGNGIGCAGVRALIGGIAQQTALRALDLSENDLNSDGLKFVSEATLQITSLLRLALADNLFTGIGGGAGTGWCGGRNAELLEYSVDVVRMHDMLELHNLGDTLQWMVHVVRLKGNAHACPRRDIRLIVKPRSAGLLQDGVTSLDKYDLLYLAPLKGGGGGVDAAPHRPWSESTTHNDKGDQWQCGGAAGGGWGWEGLPGCVTVTRTGVCGEGMNTRVEASHFTMIDLSRCHLEQLPPFVQHLKALRTLNVSKNRICSLDGSIFARLLALEIMDVSNNFLSSLPVDTLLSLPLKSLVCYYNPDLTMPGHGVSSLGGRATVEYLRSLLDHPRARAAANQDGHGPGHGTGQLGSPGTAHAQDFLKLRVLQDKYSPWKRLHLMESFVHGFEEPGRLKEEAFSLFTAVGACDGREGQITQDGIRAAFPQLDNETAEQLMAEADGDYDGHVTFEEFWQVIVSLSQYSVNGREYSGHGRGAGDDPSSVTRAEADEEEEEKEGKESLLQGMCSLTRMCSLEGKESLLQGKESLLHHELRGLGDEEEEREEEGLG